MRPVEKLSTARAGEDIHETGGVSALEIPPKNRHLLLPLFHSLSLYVIYKQRRLTEHLRVKRKSPNSPSNERSCHLLLGSFRRRRCSIRIRKVIFHPPPQRSPKAICSGYQHCWIQKTNKNKQFATFGSCLSQIVLPDCFQALDCFWAIYFPWPVFQNKIRFYKNVLEALRSRVSTFEFPQRAVKTTRVESPSK